MTPDGTDEARSPSTARPADADSPATGATPPYQQRITVPFDYPVHFTRHVFAADNPLLAEVVNLRREDRRHRVLVYVDQGLSDARPGLLSQIKDYFHERMGQLELAAPPQTVPGGEAAKRSWDLVRDILWTIGNLHLDRQSFVLAVGGGCVLDMVGFAASIVHRGLRLIRMPSTTLAQGDAGIGVKNGMDEHGQKNFIGTFAPPFAVVNDSAFLSTLPFESWIAGVAEAFKVAIIKDAGFLDDLCRDAPALRARDAAAMERAVHRCAVLHLEHIRTGGDPFEFGSARPLDFGHWAAHKLETLSGYTLGHGQAVAVGMAIDSFYALRRGLITEADLARILEGLERCGLPVYADLAGKRNRDGCLLILEGLEEFREHLGGRLTITLPDGLGRRIEVHDMDPGIVAEALEYLRKR